MVYEVLQMCCEKCQCDKFKVFIEKNPHGGDNEEIIVCYNCEKVILKKQKKRKKMKKALKVKWFSPGKTYGLIGIVIYEFEAEKFCAIAFVPGMNEEEDIGFIMDWGAKFPLEVAEKL